MLPRMLKVLAAAVFALAAQAAQALNVGDKAPDFALPSTTGKTIRLSDFAGRQSVVIFTYIGAFTKT